MTKVLSHIARVALANAMVSLEVQLECGGWCFENRMYGGRTMG